MKNMKKCRVTENKISIINKLRNRRRSSAGMFYTSSAGAVTSLILMLLLGFLFSQTVFGATYSIIYNDGVVDSMPADETGTTTGSVLLPSNNPMLITKRFSGWCLGTSNSSNITTTGGVDSCSSTVYPAGSELPISEGSNTKFLYAMWTNSAEMTFTFDAGITSIEVNGTTITASGTTMTLPVDQGYTMTVNYDSTHEYSSSTVTTGDAMIDQYNLYVRGANSTVNVASKLKPVMTFNLGTGASSVVVNGTTISASGTTMPLNGNTSYTATVNCASSYMVSATPLTVTAGDATASGLTLTTGVNNSTISIACQPAKNVSVAFTWTGGVSKVVINGVTISSSGGTASLTGGKTYTAIITLADNYSYLGSGVSSGTYYNLVDDTTNKKFDLTVGIDNGSITISAMSCITADTLVTLADGTKERVADLKGDEELLVWDFDGASYTAAPITFIDTDPEQEYDIIHTYFSDVDNSDNKDNNYITDIEVISEHGFYDYTLNKFIYINENNPEQYIGHEFIMQDGDTYKTVKLTDIKHEKKVTTPYSPVTYKHLNYYTNDMLSMPGGIEGMFNYFDVDKNTMGYDEEKKQKDIEKYGLLTLEDFDGLIDKLGFEAYNGQYLNIAIGKGLITWEGIKELADHYGHFTEEQLEDEKEAPRLLKVNEGAKLDTAKMDNLSERRR